MAVVKKHDASWAFSQKEMSKNSFLMKIASLRTLIEQMVGAQDFYRKFAFLILKLNGLHHQNYIARVKRSADFTYI